MTERDRRAVGFDFARRLASPEFRRRLHAAGYRSGEDIIPVAASEPCVVAFDRISRQCRAPAWIAIQMGARYVLMRIEPARVHESTDREPAAEPIGEGCSIGMLYHAATASRLLDAGEWERPMKVERVPVPA